MLITAGLVDRRMRIEIQATARRGSGHQEQRVIEITLDSGGSNGRSLPQPQWQTPD
jgi:hypothetical protein